MRTTQKTILAVMVVLSILTFPAGSASAQECSIDLQNPDELVGTYNDNVDQIPGILRGQVSGESVDLRLDTSDGESRYSVTTDADGRISSFEEQAASNPTIRVETSESTLCSISTSDEPVATARDAYQSGEITISGVGFVSTVKVEIIKIATRLLSGFF